MSQPIAVRQRLFVTACAVTRTTELAARRLGTARFLPALFVLRYANMGGLDRGSFAAELAGARSFQDARWCAYWDAIAETHVAAAQDGIDGLAGERLSTLRNVLEDRRDDSIEWIAELLAPAAPLLADHGPQSSRSAIERVAADHAGVDARELIPAAITLDEIVKAITYFQVSAFPGGTPARMSAYWRSRRLSDALLPVLTAGLGVMLEPFEVTVDGELVKGHAMLPEIGGPTPAVLVTNGLEGTVQELLFPHLRHRHSGLATFMIEMPGTYAYGTPMSVRSERIYDAVIEHIARDPRVDENRLAMVGVSFGGYWSTRMAATNPRLRAAVSCGAPTHHSFQPAGSLGAPQVIVEALAHVTRATRSH